MLRLVRLIFAVFAMLGCLSASTLRGNVLCIDRGGDVAVEAEHHCCPNHAPPQPQPQHHGGHDHEGGCTDLHGDVTLGREAAPSHFNAQSLEYGEVLSIAPVAQSSPNPLVRMYRPFLFAGSPPPLSPLAFLRTIILLV